MSAIPMSTAETYSRELPTATCGSTSSLPHSLSYLVARRSVPVEGWMGKSFTAPQPTVLGPPHVKYLRRHTFVSGRDERHPKSHIFSEVHTLRRTIQESGHRDRARASKPIDTHRRGGGWTDEERGGVHDTFSAIRRVGKGQTILRAMNLVNA